MSAPLIHISDSRLRRLYFEAERRRLDFRIVEDNTLEVSSSTRPGLWHRVELIGGSLRCYCEATEACTHIAISAAYYFPVRCLFAWASADESEFLNLRYRIRTNGKLTTAERRRVNRAMRQVVLPEVEQEEVCF